MYRRQPVRITCAGRMSTSKARSPYCTQPPNPHVKICSLMLGQQDALTILTKLLYLNKFTGELAARGENRGGRTPRQMPSACSPRSSPYMRCGSGGRPSLDPTSLLARSPARAHRTGISGRAATATRKSCAAAHTPLLSESQKCHCGKMQASTDTCSIRTFTPALSRRNSPLRCREDAPLALLDGMEMFWPPSLR